METVIFCLVFVICHLNDFRIKYIIMIITVQAATHTHALWAKNAKLIPQIRRFRKFNILQLEEEKIETKLNRVQMRNKQKITQKMSRSSLRFDGSRLFGTDIDYNKSENMNSPFVAVCCCCCCCHYLLVLTYKIIRNHYVIKTLTLNCIHFPCVA